MSILRNKGLAKLQKRYESIHVVFIPKCTLPIGALLDKKFGHVFLVIEQTTELSLVIDPLVFGLSGKIITSGGTKFPEWMKLHKDATVLKVKEPKQTCTFRAWPGFTLLNCVSIAKYVIGIREPLVFTPKQLYNRLVKKYQAIKL